MYNRVFFDILVMMEEFDMRRYIALLRGINVSGKNKIAMSELKQGFCELGFKDVKTYLNSGNVLFSSDFKEDDIFVSITSMIQERFDLEIPVVIISQDLLKEYLSHAPEWRRQEHKEKYDNLIFMIPPVSLEEIMNEIGNPNEKYEKIFPYEHVIFWSFSRKDYQKTNWWSKTANSRISNKITIRTGNTVRKIVGM